MHGFLGEFFGTLILILFGCEANASNSLKKTYGQNTGWLFICLAWGFAVTMGVYVAGVFGSQGHLNPAVTLPFALFGRFPWSQVFPYLTGQFLGAFIGAALVVAQFYPHFLVTRGGGNNVGIFATRPAIQRPGFNFLSEVIATAIFVFTLLNLGNFTTGLKPVVVGLLIFMVGAGLGTTTGFAINPARDWAPRLVYTILPVPNKGSAEWNYAWVPMFGPLLGAIIACGLEMLVG